MKVVSLSTYSHAGGAALAAARQHKALLAAGVDSSLLSLHDGGDGRGFYVFDDAERVAIERRRADLVEAFGVRLNRTQFSDTWFSLPLVSTGIANAPLVRQADVIQIHWASQMVSVNDLAMLTALGKPVIWTLHDEWAYTGGCHYTGGCDQYLVGCENCPQLRADPVGVPGAIHRARCALSQSRQGVIVTPSQWLGERSSGSPALNHWPHAVIPNTVDTEIFHPRLRNVGRDRLGVESETKCVLFVADAVGEHRKGLDVLIQAIERIEAESSIGDGIVFIAIGTPSQQLSQTAGLRVFEHTPVEEEIASLYAAADVVVLPSREDNLPNIILEAFSCGTPVIGSRVGGIVDFVREGESGWLVAPDDGEALERAITDSLLDASKLEMIGRRCRQLAEEEFAYSVVAERYISLYQSLRVKKEGGADRWPVHLNQLDYDAPIMAHAQKLLEFHVWTTWNRDQKAAGIPPKILEDDEVVANAGEAS